jgi:ABC-type polysaccharide/polyol phosphate export permease
MLVIPILETLFNPVLLNSYSQIYRNHAMGLVWLVLSGLIYIVTLVLAYVAIQETGLWPKFSSVIPATTAMFFYFFFIKAITPYLYSLWR